MTDKENIRTQAISRLAYMQVKGKKKNEKKIEEKKVW